VVVTEGEFDAICVQAYCGIPAVAYPGADTWARCPHWKFCFEGIPEVVVVADGDDVGHKAAVKVAESIGWSARVVRMPEEKDEKDANSFIIKHGAEAFVHRLNA
jgi:DNA primase